MTRPDSRRPPRTSRPCSPRRSRGSRGWATCSRGRSTWSSRAWSATVSQAGEKAEPARAPQAKLRASALNHLKQAAAQLPGVAEAQARYGVALVLTNEQSPGPPVPPERPAAGEPRPPVPVLGRLDDPPGGLSRGGRADRRFALPQLAQGTIPAELKGTLHQISRRALPGPRGPGDLERAAQEFDKAAALGQAADSGDRAPPGPDRRPARTARRGAGAARAAAGRRAREARRREPGRADPRGAGQEGRGPQAASKAARLRYPKAPELAGLEAALAAKDGKPDEADRVLKDVPRRRPRQRRA